MTETSVASAPAPLSLSHARARLLVGMSAVGSIVIACLLALAAFAIMSFYSVESGIDLPIVTIPLLYLFYLSLQGTADLCGGVIIPLVFHKRSDEAVRLASQLGLGIIRHGILNITTLGVLVAGSALFGRAGLLIASIVNITTLLLLQKHLFQFIGAIKLQKDQANQEVISTGLDEGFTGGVVDSIGETISLLPSTATGLGYEYKTLRFNILRKLQSKVTRILLPILTNGIGSVFAIYCMRFFQSLPVRDVVLYSLCTTVWSFILLLVLPALNRRAVLSLDRELVSSGLKFNEFELAVSIEDSRGEDEYSRSTLVQSVFYPIPAPETRFKYILAEKGPARFWIAFHQIARRSLYTSLGCGGFLSRSVHCNVGRPELWIISPSD